MKISIFFDGSCGNVKNESAPMGIGVAIFINGSYREDLSFSIGISTGESEDRGTNNIAEWNGCVYAMEAASCLREEYPQAKIQIFSDSKVIASQFNGEFAITNPTFNKHFDIARKTAAKAQVKRVEWIPREMNKEADVLSKEGRQKAIKKDSYKTINLNTNGKEKDYSDKLPF